ncbi:MAG: bifunctional pyr operon transcriptional regulator/uracil phosphoribosyltransferase PyrR, partial [Pseudonocardia sp.]|nr:bifunctional pyr operon transcriptional regulator/uracil phosphoribosyltransferase PyrR [Pseudonocardia sp.]
DEPVVTRTIARMAHQIIEKTAGDVGGAEQFPISGQFPVSGRACDVPAAVVRHEVSFPASPDGP